MTRRRRQLLSAIGGIVASVIIVASMGGSNDGIIGTLAIYAIFAALAGLAIYWSWGVADDLRPGGDLPQSGQRTSTPPYLPPLDPAQALPWTAPGAAAAPYQPVQPAWSDADHTRLERWMAALADAGVLRPGGADAAAIAAAMADFGEVWPSAILMSIAEWEEAQGIAPADSRLSDLAFLDSKTEQLEELIREQVADLDRVTGGALGLSITAIDWPPLAEMPGRPVAITLAIGGSTQTLSWRSNAKYASTILPAAVARAYHALGRGDAIAALWCDQGAWLMRLSPDARKKLNARLRREGVEEESFEWLHVGAPFASGDPPPQM